MEPEVTRELQKRITKRVRKILEQENLYQMTEKKVRELASEELGFNLSDEPFKSIVSHAVENFLEKLKTQKETQKNSVQVQELVKEKRRSN